MAETPQRPARPHSPDPRTLTEEIRDRSEADKETRDKTPLTGASRAGTPPRPPHGRERPTDDPTLPPGAR